MPVRRSPVALLQSAQTSVCVFTPIRKTEHANHRLKSVRTQVINLRGQNEVALSQAINFMRPDSDLGLAPAKANVRMMSLLFRQFAHTIHEVERLAEVLELVFLVQ